MSLERKPKIDWDSSGGPMFISSKGRVHWLTLWERFLWKIGYIDIMYLEIKYHDY